MDPVRVRNDLVDHDPELRELANDVDAISIQFSELRYEPVPRGRDDFGGLSWRCRAYANANLLRGEELLRLCIQAINDGALIGAHLIARALDETSVAVTFAKRGIARFSAQADPAALDEFLTKLLVGNQYMAARDERHPRSHRIHKMIEEVDKYFRELAAGRIEAQNPFAASYAFCSEFVHPSQGSFAAYQRVREDRATVFERPAQLEQRDLAALLRQIRVSSHLLLTQAADLAATEDLPLPWPR